MYFIIIFMLASLHQPAHTWHLDLGYKWWEIISSDFKYYDEQQTHWEREILPTSTTWRIFLLWPTWSSPHCPPPRHVPLPWPGWRLASPGARPGLSRCWMLMGSLARGSSRVTSSGSAGTPSVLGRMWPRLSMEVSSIWSTSPSTSTSPVSLQTRLFQPSSGPASPRPVTSARWGRWWTRHCSWSILSWLSSTSHS